MDTTSHQTYSFDGPVSAHQVLEKAAEIIAERYLRGEAFCSSQATKDFVKFKLGNYEREVFAALYLDSQHRLIEYEELFFGTINAASVYPREVARSSLKHNSAAVIFAHNHPSGDPSPSVSDKQITQRLKEALALLDINVLDHIVVGESAVSFAEQGWL